MNTPSATRKRTKTKRKSNSISWAVGFSPDEIKMIQQLQNSTSPRLSFGDIVRRSITFAVPKFLSGEEPVLTFKPQTASAGK